MKSDYSAYLINYRKDFLKKKNKNRYKSLPKGTPKIIEVYINALDRKIKQIPLLNDDKKREYLDGVKKIHTSYYEETFEPKPSRGYSYINYVTTQYIVWGKKEYKKYVKPYKEFIKLGLSNKYKQTTI